MASVIASGAKQSHGSYLRDCLVATLLAMTKGNVRERLQENQGWESRTEPGRVIRGLEGGN